MSEQCRTQRLEEAVQRGANLLDYRWPYWAEAINLDLFDISDYSLCIIGQVYNEVEFCEGLSDLFDGNQITEAQRHGFDFNTSSEAETLQDLWESAIVERQKY